MKVLVTGVTGFLGGRVAERLTAGGHAVRGFVRDESRWADRPADAEVVVGDVTDAAAFDRAADGCDVVLHAAALVKIAAAEVTGIALHTVPNQTVAQISDSILLWSISCTAVHTFLPPLHSASPG